MPKSFSCEKCHFECCKQSNYNSHLLTAKHQNVTNVTNISDQSYNCTNCNTNYKSRVGLWRHSKKCIVVNTPTECISSDLVIQLINTPLKI